MWTISREILAAAIGFVLMLAFIAISRSDGIENPFARGVFEAQGPNNYSAAGGSGPPPLSNLRITNVPDFRVTNTGDNRAVAP